MATLEQIQTRMKKLQLQAEALLARRAQAAVDQIRDIMLKHGLTTTDIEIRAKAKRDARFGKRLKANGVAKTSAGAKGKLPPKYRDPKTGATWSGHARPPAWIKDAKDRTRFLINGATAALEGNGASKVAKAVKKVSAKKAAVKKAVAKRAPAKKAAAKKTVAKKASVARKAVTGKTVRAKAPASKRAGAKKAAGRKSAAAKAAASVSAI
jgi:DNA-binding protein H-NS